MSETDDLVDALAPVIAALQAIGISHYVGGSVASSFHGATRSTMDVDLVCELTEQQISPFITSLNDDFYISESAIRDAVKRKSCFNLIHLPTSFKVDVFISRGRPFDVNAMQRATTQQLGDSRTVAARIATAEDSIVSKLEWFRLTNETSERQWDDVTKLIKLLDDAADVEYLHEASASVGVGDLLDRLLKRT